MGAVLHEVRPYSGRGLRIGRGRDAHAPSALRNVGSAWGFPPWGNKGGFKRVYAEMNNDGEKFGKREMRGNKNPAMPWGLRDENI